MIKFRSDDEEIYRSPGGGGTRGTGYKEGIPGRMDEESQHGGQQNREPRHCGGNAPPGARAPG